MTESDVVVCSLFSGSGGNCTYFRAADTEILIDAGVSAGAIAGALKEIGTELSRISAVFVTHEHCDHVKGLEVLCKKHPIPIHISAESASCMTASAHLRDCLVLHTPPYEVQVGEVMVRAFAVPHDSVCCVGFRICARGKTVVLATDLGRVTKELIPEFLGANGVILESNHDISLLKSNPNYPPMLKARILSGEGHLSNELSARFLAYLAENGTSHALLAHLSKENNTPSLALAAITERLTTPISVQIAKERGVTRLF